MVKSPFFLAGVIGFNVVFERRLSVQAQKEMTLGAPISITDCTWKLQCLPRKSAREPCALMC